MAKSVVTPERFASGMTFEEYLVYIGSPENLAREGFGYYGGSFGAAPRKDNSTVIRERYTRARLAAHQREAITWLAAQPGGPARILVISCESQADRRTPAADEILSSASRSAGVFPPRARCSRRWLYSCSHARSLRTSSGRVVKVTRR